MGTKEIQVPSDRSKKKPTHITRIRAAKENENSTEQDYSCESRKVQ